MKTKKASLTSSSAPKAACATETAPTTPAITMDTPGIPQKRVPTIKVDEIKISPLFSTLFPKDPATVAAIRDSIRKEGYHDEEPVSVWDETDELLDGHQRHEAGKAAGMEEIPAVRKSFATREEAFAYAVRRQRDRRQLTKKKLDSLIFNAVAIHDLKLLPGRPSKGAPATEKGKSAVRTAKLLGTTRTKVEKSRTIMSRGDKATKEALCKGEMTMEKAYRATVTKTESTDVKGFQPNRGKKMLGAFCWSPITGYDPKAEPSIVQEVPHSVGKTEPEIWPAALKIAVTPPAEGGAGANLVRCCEYTDIGAPWVSDEWREKLFAAIRDNPGFNFLISTQHACKLAEMDIPRNVWVATRIFDQSDVPKAIEAIRVLSAKREAGSGPVLVIMHCFPSDEINLAIPLMVPGVLDAVIVDVLDGGEMPSTEHVEPLVAQAREAGCSIFLERGIVVAPHEIPTRSKRADYEASDAA